MMELNFHSDHGFLDLFSNFIHEKWGNMGRYRIGLSRMVLTEDLFRSHGISLCRLYVTC